MSLPHIYGHRGMSTAYPENTLLAIEKTIDCGAEGIEIDVHLSKDKHVIVLHDLTVDRTTDHKGLLSTFLLDEIRMMDAGLFKGSQFSGERVPTLAEVLALVKEKRKGLDKDIKLMVEIKSHILTRKGFFQPIEELVQRVLDDIAAADAHEFIEITTFCRDYIYHIHRVDPSITTHLLVPFWFRPGPHLASLPVKSINPNINAVTKSFVEKVQSHGKEVCVWTVDKAHDLEFCVYAGVDGIITNVPDVAQNVIQAFDRDSYFPPRPFRERMSLRAFVILLVALASYLVRRHIVPLIS
mmetsp:Transcript_16879/g.31043  ORF Transcript_16879/g.31043 Transcript_16879/m.31043 type:complete len:297 (+) Transcript_16879:241-1131(+)